MDEKWSTEAMTIINIRGTNGSGKTTLARALLGWDPDPVDLIWYPSPTKRDPTRSQPVEGWGHPGGYLAVGSYAVGCGGMDTVPSFKLQQEAVAAALRLVPPPRHVICEGVLASTVFGSWGEFFTLLQSQGHRVLVAYLDTPVELCLERIRERQRASPRGEHEIKEDLVRGKVRAIEATRARFREAGIETVTLDHRVAEQQIREVVE